jgi:hypothetical protein
MSALKEKMEAELMHWMKKERTQQYIKDHPSTKKFAEVIIGTNYSVFPSS